MLALSSSHLPAFAGSGRPPDGEARSAGAPPSTVILPNGVRLISASKAGVDWTTFELAFPLGAAGDPPGKAGLARVAGLVAKALVEQAQGGVERDSSEPRVLARSGGLLSVETGARATALRGGVAGEHLDVVMRAMLRALATASPGESEVRRAIEQVIAEDDASRVDDRAIAESELGRLLAGPASGGRRRAAIEELATITPEDVRAVLRQKLRGGDLVLGLATTLAHPEVVQRAAGWVEPIPAGRDARPGPLEAPRPKRGRHLVLIDRPARSEPGPAEAAGQLASLGRPTAELTFGHVLSDDDRAGSSGWALTAANAAIGGATTARLLRTLARREAIPAPAAATWLESGDTPYFAGGLSAPSDELADRLSEVLRELEELHARGLSAEELQLGSALADARASALRADPRAAITLAVFGQLDPACARRCEEPWSQATLAEPSRSAAVDRAARALARTEDLVVVVVAVVTPELERALSRLPGFDGVSISSYGDVTLPPRW